MLGRRKGVATKLKKKISHFLLSINFVAHKPNLASHDVASSRSFKNMSKVIGKLLHDIISHLKKSSKAKCELSAMKKEWFDT